MPSPKVSVIIPVYNGAPYLHDSIQSVLNQTFQDFELIIVNDASTDNSADVVRRFSDRRLKYIEHVENRWANAARNTGIHASSGNILVFLDQDDMFHPEKLQTHVTLLDEHPEVGVSYNSRFELLHSYTCRTSKSPDQMVRDLWRPPRRIALADMIVGFPFCPSDMVVRREWAFRAGLWPDTHEGSEILFEFRLWTEGCKFASVDRALTYRRPHSERLANLARRCKNEITCQEMVFSDERCPDELRSLQNIAHANIYLVHSYHALAQEETDLGQELIRKAVQLYPPIVEGSPCRLVDFLAFLSTLNESLDHEAVLRTVFAQLPAELSWLSEEYGWCVKYGHLLLGARAIFWGRLEDGRRHFDMAKSLGARTERPFLHWLTQRMLDYEVQFGATSVKQILREIVPCLESIGGRSAVRWLNGCYLVNRAFESHRNGQSRDAAWKAAMAIGNNPKYLVNRGVLSILVRSITGLGCNEYA